MAIKTYWERKVEERMMKLKPYWERQVEERAEQHIRELNANWERKTEDEKLKSKMESKLELISKYLHTRFGEAAQDLQAELAKSANAALLDSIAEALFRARSLEEAEAIIAQKLKE